MPYEEIGLFRQPGTDGCVFRSQLATHVTLNLRAKYIASFEDHLLVSDASVPPAN